MFKTIINSKLKSALTTLLALSFTLQLIIPASAGSNGSGTGSPGGAATATTWGQAGWDSGIAIFLTKNSDYIR